MGKRTVKRRIFISNYPVEEVPIHTIYRDKDNSNSHFRKVRDSVRIYKDILKFTFSSLSGFVMDYLLFSLLMLFLPHSVVYTLLANTAARVMSAFYNYSMNCRFVFHTKRKAETTARYFALAGCILVMNHLILGVLAQGFCISVYPAKLLTECILFAFSWMVQRFVIFRKERDSEAYEKQALSACCKTPGGFTDTLVVRNSHGSRGLGRGVAGL